MTLRAQFAVDEPIAEVVPLAIGPRNCEAALGVPWRWMRGKARELGVPIYELDRKSMIPAAPLMSALANAGLVVPRPANNQNLNDEELRDKLRRELGMQRIRSNP